MGARERGGWIRVWAPWLMLAAWIVPAASAAAAPGAPAGPLATLTIGTRSLESARLFYVDGFGMTLEGPLRPDPRARRALAALWQLPADATWSTYVLSRAGIADAARIRLLVFDRAAPSVRQDWEPAVLGPYTIGFPTVQPETLDARLRALGFGARNPLERTPFTSPEGRSWEILEALYTGPDFVAAVGIARGAGHAPISPVDAAGLGGPAYSMMVVPDVARMANFVRDVLGWEIRTQREQTSSGRTGSMNTPDGTRFELAHLHPPTGRHGFLLLLQFRNLPVRAPAVPPRLPASGLWLYSFPVAKLEPVLARAAEAGATQIRGPRQVDSPPHGNVRHATFVAPNGVRFELFESAGGSAATTSAAR